MIGNVISAGEYPVMQFYKDQGKPLADHLDEAWSAVAAAGLGGFEPFVPETNADVDRLASLIARHKLAVPSAYANARLHDQDWPTRADAVVENALRLKPLGLTTVVCNPEPIAWGKPLDKDDAQLRRQALALSHLTTTLATGGITLAYHTHDPEMRNAAREFHHMMLATTDVNMRLCLDDHWIYRGAGNSNVALQDILMLYGNRIGSLHLRQSRGGVWSETLGDGDVDFAPIVQTAKTYNFAGPVTFEQAYETGTPRTLGLTESLARSLAWYRTVFE